MERIRKGSDLPKKKWGSPCIKQKYSQIKLPQRSSALLVQFLNSPFFPPHIGAEPRRAKEESRITYMRMLRTPPFSPPNRGENHIWKYFPDLACGTIFWIIIYKRQFLHKNMSTNPKSVDFHQCHAKRHSIWFFYHNIKDDDRNLCQDLLTIENTDSDLKVHALHYANELLVRFKNFPKLATQHAETIRKNVWEKSCDAYSLSIRVQTPTNHILICFLP